jgi:hypothetical protein
LQGQDDEKPAVSRRWLFLQANATDKKQKWQEND